MTSAAALFGNGSWMSTAANYVPQGTYDITDPNNSKKLPWQLFRRGRPFSKLWAPGNSGFADPVGNDVVSLCGSLDQSILDATEVKHEDLLQATIHFLDAFAAALRRDGDRKE
jgi:hypothetical protein